MISLPIKSPFYQVNKLLLVILPMLVSFVLFKFLFGFYFFQDDWFNFNITNVQGFKGFFGFFEFREDIIAYRPLGLQTFFFIFRKLFDLNAFNIRVINFGMLAITYFLILYVSKYIVNNKWVSIFTGFLWITSSIHFMNMGVINYNLLGSFFWLSTFLTLILYVKKNQSNYYLLSIFIYIVSLFVWENSMSFPLIALLFLHLFRKRTNFTETIKTVAPYLVITIAFLIFRQLNISKLSVVEYKITFNLESIKAFFWYILWTFNIPEEFKKQIVDNFIIFNKLFLRDYKILVLKTFTFALLIIVLGVIIPLKKIENISLIDKKIVAFSLFWFILTIFPVLWLPNHNFIMYLTLPSIGIYFLISYLIELSKIKLLYFACALIWILSSFTTLSFYKNNFFIVDAQRASRKFVFAITSVFPSLPTNSIVYFPINSKQQKQAIFEQNSIKAVYKDSSLSIAFTKEEALDYLRKTGDKRFIYIYTPE